MKEALPEAMFAKANILIIQQHHLLRVLQRLRSSWLQSDIELAGESKKQKDVANSVRLQSIQNMKQTLREYEYECFIQ